MIQETEGFPVAEELTTLGLGGNPEPPRPSAGNRPHVEWPFLAPTFLIPNSQNFVESLKLALGGVEVGREAYVSLPH